MSSYPEYACSCCGYANGDMFYDWLNAQEDKFIKYKKDRAN